MPRFDLEQFLRICQDHKSRRMWIVPPVALALAKHPLVDEFDLSSIEQIFSGAAPLGAELSNAVGERLDCVSLQGYGMTELSPVSHVTPVTAARAGASGLALPNTECRIVDIETGDDKPAGEEGELWIRGPQVMKGYLNNLKELIKFKGFQVAPAELEAMLVSHPGIIDAAVIGLPDPEAGELPIAFVIATDPAPSEDEIKAFLSGTLATYKQIHRVEFVEKSSSGKILRRRLKGLLNFENQNN